MVALALPLVWMATDLVGLTQLYGMASKVAFGGLLLDRWLAKKCVDLGIDPKDFEIGVGEKEAERRRVAYSLGLELDETMAPLRSRILVTKIEPHQVEGMLDLVGTWAFIGLEWDDFVDEIRHRELVLGIGDYAARLKALIENKGIEYEELSFLWEGHAFDIHKLRRLSEARLKDPVFRKAAGLPMFE